MADSASGGFMKYVARAFRQRWNLGLLGVAAAFAILSPFPDALLPLVVGLEGAYLLGMVSRPRFRDYVDAQDAAASREASAVTAEDLFTQLRNRLSLGDRQRFEKVVTRCEDMRRLARTVRAGRSSDDDSTRDAALNKLLFFYLRLLVGRRSLEQFLASSNRYELESQRRELAERLTAAEQKAAEPGGDQRILSSLRDTVKDLDTRIANVSKGEKDAEFVELELTRIEGKVHALSEGAITSQDPGDLSAQVTAFTETLQLSQDVASQMISLDDLELASADAPPILGSARVTSQRLR
ncbi:MAG: hypothetical protein IT360_07925 [Gemmatimonadaceae bacterium]|nr:hypothetical protein [Gemmatimonadaceae bacterium]